MSATRRRLAFWLVLLAPALVQFASLEGRLSGDGASYYAQLRSLAKDRDMDLAGEYAALGLGDRPDLRVPTRTGLRRTVFPVGPALLLLPFFALGEALARLHGLLGGAPDLSGYGPWHVETVAIGGLLYGMAAVWLVESTLRRHFSAGAARLVALLAWLATFLHWYMVQQPVMSHAPSAFTAALFLWQWDRRRRELRTRDALVLGLLCGLAMCVRWQNAVLLALPAVDLARAALREGSAPALRAAAGRMALAGMAAAAGALPQMLVWRAVFGEWLLLAPPQGADFVRLGRPFLLETLFASRHGLLSWTPVLWLGFVGFVPLLRRRPALAWPLLIPLAALTYVNACSGDWWAGGSFSNRRFDSLLPVLAFGMAAAVESLRRALRRHPMLMPAALAALFAAWNVALVTARARGTLPADDTASFDAMVGGVATTVAGAAGSPATWPASWLFAARHGLPPSRYDALVGRYLFYRQNNQRGCVEPGAAGFEPQLAGAWAAQREETAAGPARRLWGYGRVYVGLDLPEDLWLEIDVAAERETPIEVDVNGVLAARLAAAAPGTLRLAAPRQLWRRDLNSVGLRPAGVVRVHALRFLRAAGEPPAPCGLLES